MRTTTAILILLSALALPGFGKTVVALNPLSAEGDLAAERALISDILLAELSGSPEITVVDREQLSQALRELQLGDQGMVSPESAKQIGKIVGAKYFCGGKLSRSGDKTMAVVRIVDIETTVTKLAYAQLTGEADAITAGKALADNLVTLIAAFEAEKAAVTAETASAKQAIPADWKRPSVMVVIPEMHVRQPVLIDPAAETEIVKRLLADGFQVIDSEYTVMMARDPENSGGLFSTRKTTADYAAQKGAAILLYGEAISEQGAQLDAFEGCRARVELKAIDTKTGNILVADSAYAGATDLAETVAGKKAIQKAANVLSDTFLYRLAEAWNKQ
jgi:TolB-like protein